MAESDISNQNEVKRKGNKHAFLTHFKACLCTLKKKKKKRKSKVFPLLASGMDDGETDYTFPALYMAEIYKAISIYIYGGLTRQKRSKETARSHKSFGVSDHKTTSEAYICMYIYTYMYIQAVSGEAGLEANEWKVPAGSRTGPQSC